MRGYLVFIKLHDWLNLWRGRVAKSWWLGYRMKCAMQRPLIYSVLRNFWPLQRVSARAALSRDVPVAKRSVPLGGNTLTPVLAGSTFQSLPLFL